MMEGRQPSEAERDRWSSVSLFIVSTMYLPPALFPIAVIKQDAAFLTPLLGFTAFGYLGGIPWVLWTIGLYDPPVSGGRALGIQLAGLAPWLIVWAADGRFAPLTQMTFIFPIVLIWSYVAHWLARMHTPERRLRVIHAFFWTSAAQVLAALAIVMQAQQPHLSAAGFVPAALALCVAAYALIVGRPKRREPMA